MTHEEMHDESKVGTVSDNDYTWHILICPICIREWEEETRNNPPPSCSLSATESSGSTDENKPWSSEAFRRFEQIFYEHECLQEMAKEVLVSGMPVELFPLPSVFPDLETWACEVLLMIFKKQVPL